MVNQAHRLCLSIIGLLAKVSITKKFAKDMDVSSVRVFPIGRSIDGKGLQSHLLVAAMGNE